MRKLWPSKDVGQGGPLRGREDRCHSWGEEAGKSRGPLGAGLGGWLACRFPCFVSSQDWFIRQLS